MLKLLTLESLNMPCSDCGKESFFVKLSKLFIALLNLNLGFPLCFYDGMTELWKAGLSLLFPVYLILIIVFLIILSHFSSQVSNKLSKSSVQVLVTIVHLSFTKLLEAVIDVFGSAKVYEEGNGERIVWYNSGAVEYGSMEHTWLMVITSIVVGFILTPYFILILFGKFLLKCDRFREYVRLFYEAIHAPYKTNRWYWFHCTNCFCYSCMSLKHLLEIQELCFKSFSSYTISSLPPDLFNAIQKQSPQFT